MRAQTKKAAKAKAFMGAGASAGVREPGRREQNKLDKLNRIKDAARHLFVARGFDDTTIREIAARAGVGLGTVFVYAENKRDLLFLIANEGLEQAAMTAQATIDPRRSLLGNLLAMFRPLYEFFARHPALSRLVLREMTFYASGAQAGEFQKTREVLIGLVRRIVDDAAAKESIRTGETSEFVAWTIFSIYQVELRRWIASDEPDLALGLERLGRAFTLLLTGLSPARGALALTPPCRD